MIKDNKQPQSSAHASHQSRHDTNAKRGRQAGHPGGPPGMMPGEKPKQFKVTLKRLLTYLKPYRLRLFFIFVAAVCSTIFNIFSPRILGQATDVLVTGIMDKFNGVANASINFERIAFILAMLGLLYVLSALFGYFQGFLMAKVAQKVVYTLRKEVKQKLGKLSLKFFDSRSNGDILSRVVNDVDNIANTLQQSLTQMITSVVTLLGIVIMMLVISPLLTLITLLSLPLSFIVVGLVAKQSQKHFKNQQRQLGDLNGHVEEMFTGHAIIKAYGQEQKSIQTFKHINDELYQSNWKAQFISGIMMPLMGFIGNISYVFICIIGGIQVTRQTISVGDIQAFFQYTRQFTMPIQQTAQIANIIQSTIASAERVFELLDEEEETERVNVNTKSDYIKGEVVFRNVKFGYDANTPLMQNMNLHVKPGQTVAIVGPTGAGKTTLVNLLMRYYPINDGEIEIDGQSIYNYSRSTVRSMFGMVLQDTWLFNGTIAENIAYGREDATFDEVVKAAKAAYADHFIRTLPDGYHTILNEEASNISIGQKQLLTIARAILANPSMLILDEATSSVDTRTEVQIQKVMKTLMDGRTSFVIAHRLSTIRDADVILVMNHGTIIEQGNHDQLLAVGGFYAELYHSQFSEEATSTE